MILVYWILFFLLPAALTICVAFYQKSIKARSIVIHSGLLVSILLLLFAGARLQLTVVLASLVCFVAAIILASYLLARFVVIYIISSLLQELCLLLAAVLLSHQVGLIWAAVFTALVYSSGHLVDRGHWQIKLPITTFWGICSIILYYYFRQPLLNCAIHIAGGAILINQGMLFKNS